MLVKNLINMSFSQQEDDAIKGASAANAEMFYQRLSKSAAHPSSSASTQIPQGGFSVKKGKTPSRRQLFTGVQAFANLIVIIYLLSCYKGKKINFFFLYI